MFDTNRPCSGNLPVVALLPNHTGSADPAVLEKSSNFPKAGHGWVRNRGMTKNTPSSYANPISMILLAGCQLALCGSALADESDYAAARQQMVAQQLVTPDHEITNPAVLAAMGKVPRHAFVPAEDRDRAYAARPLPIGYEQTISQPFMVALMTQKLEPKPTDKVLEVGTGSGYQSAVLSGLVKAVYTIEIVAPLAERAAKDLKRLGYANVNARAGDGYKGWPEAAPFDSIIVTCAPDHVPQPLVDQLKEGGRMIIPVGPIGEQTLCMLTKKAGKIEKLAVVPVHFVPMTGTANIKKKA